MTYKNSAVSQSPLEGELFLSLAITCLENSKAHKSTKKVIKYTFYDNLYLFIHEKHTRLTSEWYFLSVDWGVHDRYPFIIV